MRVIRVPVFAWKKKSNAGLDFKISLFNNQLLFFPKT